MELFFDDSDQHIGGDGAPDLRLHRVLARAQKALDAQVLFDPFKEQLHLPTTLVQRGNGQWRQCRVVGQKHQRLARIGIFESDAPQMLWIVLGHVKPVESNRLIADHTGASVGLGRVNPMGIHAAFGSSHKERTSLMYLEEPVEVHVTPIHHIEHPCFDGQDVEHFDVAHLAIADVNEGRNCAAQVQQRVHQVRIGDTALLSHFETMELVMSAYSIKITQRSRKKPGGIYLTIARCFISGDADGIRKMHSSAYDLTTQPSLVPQTRLRPALFA